MKCWLILAAISQYTNAFSSSLPHHNCDSSLASTALYMSDAPAGSFFNKPPDKDDDDDDKKNQPDLLPTPDMFTINKKSKKVDKTRPPAKGFGVANKKKPYVAIGQPDRVKNDLTKPEFDKNGYTLYENEKTGEKKRVFDALLEYPCDFSLKVVGAKEGTFVEDMVQIVADCCKVNAKNIFFTTRDKGKWVSVTMKAPVENAEMVYQLYENIDKDSRVKFKF